MIVGSQRFMPEFDVATGEFTGLEQLRPYKFLHAGVQKNKAQMANSLSQLYNEAMRLIVPDTLNNMLYAMTQSEEVYTIYIALLGYFVNICILQSWMAYKPKTPNAKTLDAQLTKQLAHTLAQMGVKEVAKFVSDESSQRGRSLTQEFSELYANVAARNAFKISFTYQTSVRYTNINFEFAAMKPCFRYNLDRISENLHIVCYELNDSEKEYYERFIIKDPNFQYLAENGAAKTMLDVSQVIEVAGSILMRTNIASGTFKPVLKLLCLRVLGQDFARIDDSSYCMVTPQQLVILLADTNKHSVKFAVPQSYVVLNIAGYPYFYLKYKIDAPFETVSMLSQYHTKLMSGFLAYLAKISADYYNSIPHRALFFHSLSTNNIFVKIPKEYDSSCDFLLPAVPTGTIELQDLSPQLHFIHSNLRLDYVFQFVLIYVISAGLLLCEPLASYIEHVITLGQALGEDGLLYKQMLGLTDKIATLIKMISRSVYTPQLLYFCVTRNNMMNEQILAIITALRCGFLSLTHSTMQKIFNFELNHYEFVRYDRQTIWQTFLQYMQMYAKHEFSLHKADFKGCNSPELVQDVPNSARSLFNLSLNNTSGNLANLSMRAYLCQKIPLLEAFLELDELPFFGLTERQVEFRGPSSTSELAKPLAPEHAKCRLIALIHELQHIPRHSYLSDLDLKIPLLPYILADATSITPLSAAIRFHYKDYAGVDAGGMWRATLTLLFDDLLGESLITNEVLYYVKAASKFGNRELQFEILNYDNPNQPSLLKVINLNNKSILVPHYNGYNCQTSSSIFPRLTDKRSCLYYLGRVFSFCLVYSGKVPDFLHFNFWKSLVGGRLFFDEDLIEKHKREYESDPMFRINGTKRFTELLYPLTMEYIYLYYKQYADIWQTALRGEITDVDMLGIHPKIVEELLRQQVNLNVEGNVYRYAKLALRQLSTGQSLGKAYSEFRNGFRHPFATSMVNPVGPELQQLARNIDICFDVISWRDLHDFMTFDPSEEELLNRNDVVDNLLGRNIASIELEHDYTDEKMLIFNRIKTLLCDSANYSHKEILDFVFAVTGQRSLQGTEIIISFIKPTKENRLADGKFERKFILFHTCFNYIDVPIGYCRYLTDSEFVYYFKECIQFALQNGFAMT